MWRVDFPTNVSGENRESRDRSCRLHGTGATAPHAGSAGKRISFTLPWVRCRRMPKKKSKHLSKRSQPKHCPVPARPIRPLRRVLHRKLPQKFFRRCHLMMAPRPYHRISTKTCRPCRVKILVLLRAIEQRKKQTPQSTGPAEKPTFRDPDAIFDKSDGSKKPQATPRILPTLPKDGGPTAEPTTTPQPTKPTPSPATPQDRQTTPGQQPDSQPPAEQQPQWEKRTREKPADPQEIQKQAPKKKPGEPFYDPDSIFDDRATRATGPEKVRWQKAGTVSPPSPHGPSGTTDRKIVSGQMQERIFSQVKPVVPTATTQTAAPKENPLSAAKTAAPALFEAERPRPIPNQRATWKPAKNQNPPPTRQVPVRQDRQVRPVAFEEPVATQSAANQRVLPTTPPVKVAAVRQRKSALPPAPPLDALSAKDGSFVTRTTAVTRKIASPVQKAKPVSSEKNVPETESIRNPMRDPLTSEESENISAANPLREHGEPPFKDAAEIQNKRSNPLR